MSKQISELSLEELMEIAKIPIKEQDYKHLSVVRRFILQDELEQGSEKIPAYLIYDRFLAWAERNLVETMAITSFFKEFQHYFNRKVTSTGIVYSLSPKGFDLSPQNLIQAKERLGKSKRISNGKKNKKTRKKKKLQEY